MLLATLLSGLFLHFGATTVIQSGVCHPITTPIIIQPVSGTQTAQQQLTVTGTTDPNEPIRIVDNGQAVATTTGDNAGDYAVSMPLMPGQNSIVSEAYDPCGRTADSQPVTVQDNMPSQSTSPIGEVSLPQAAPLAAKVIHAYASQPSTGLSETVGSGATTPTKKLTLSTTNLLSFTTTGDATFLSGSTNLDADITVYVSGQILATFDTAANHVYQVLVPLNPGNNLVTVTATSGMQKANLRYHVERVAPVAPHRTFWSSGYGKLILIGGSITAITMFVIEEKAWILKRWR